jgi:hypothetical protein
VPKFNKNFKFVRFSGGFAALFLVSSMLLSIMLLSALSCGRENIAGGPSDVETYGFTFSGGASYTFPAGIEDVYTAGTHEVTITNTGSLATGVISIELSSEDAFELSGTNLASIAPEGQASFSVSTIAGLSGGAYTATITASGEGGFEKEYDVSFTVGDPVLELTIVSGETLTFDEKIAGYAAAPDAKEITVENTGNQPLTGVAVNGGTAYSASPSTANLAVGESIAFAVKPNIGLASSDYSAVLTIEAAGGVAPAEFEAAFSVRNGNITKETPTNGTLALSHTQAQPNTQITVTATPEENYAVRLAGFTPSEVEFSRTNATTYKFDMPPGADVRVGAQFVNPNDHPMATGGTVTLLSTGTGAYDEVHIFTSSGTLGVNRAPAAGSTKILVVGGGGGGGGGDYPAGGGGAGGYIEKNNYTLTTGSKSVTIGSGGGGGVRITGDGDNGGNSQFDSYEAYGGGGGAKRTNKDSNSPGLAGGSSGGSAGNSVSPAATKGIGGQPDEMFGNAGGYGGSGGTVNNHVSGGGGAGGPGTYTEAQISADQTRGKGPGKQSNISGADAIYAEGGPLPWSASGHTSWTPPTYGSGGVGGWNSDGSRGKAGIVIIRFPWT